MQLKWRGLVVIADSNRFYHRESLREDLKLPLISTVSSLPARVAESGTVSQLRLSFPFGNSSIGQGKRLIGPRPIIQVARRSVLKLRTQHFKYVQLIKNVDQNSHAAFFKRTPLSLTGRIGLNSKNDFVEQNDCSAHSVLSKNRGN